MQFETGAGEQMRLTGTGLGIGTSSPAYKLDVRGDVVGGLNNKIGIRRSDGAFVSYLQNSGDTETKLVSDGGGSTLTFYTEGAKKATLDSSGNLGLGVTPSAWGSVERALQVGNSLSLIRGSSSEAVLAYNAYLNSSGSYIYNITANSSRYEQLAGQHRWLTASSGTAGNAITFTQAMTLDASGRLGIGTTSPSQLLDVRGTSSPTIKVRNDTATTDTYAQFLFEGVNTFSGTSTSYIRSITSNSGNSSTALTFGTNADGGGAAAERARIDSSGNLLVGCTSTPSSSVVGWRATKSGDQGYMSSSAGSSGAREHWYLYNTNGLVGTVSTSGTSTTYATSSDYRLKENIAPMTGALATVAQLKPCTYTWKTDGVAGQGFIAHELQAVVPDAVVGEKDAVDAEGNPKYQGIDTSFLVATLTAAIQELKAEFDAYKASHP
jgi:hypothetical protein